ncbi:hypothetical protein LIER_22144 [Lithospermum erythrorhizon]|uniref:Uncharacterized protein n=1 Tax=Lithospermum erythrorhizon TaxID=34254 RepID=A0AAV3QVZ2_LITER
MNDLSSAQTQTNTSNAIPPNPLKSKLEFPHFDGSKVRPWLCKCNLYFALNPMSEQQKLDMAAMHMDGKLEIWLHGILTSNPPLTWAEFTDSLALRFDDKTHNQGKRVLLVASLLKARKMARLALRLLVPIWTMKLEHWSKKLILHLIIAWLQTCNNWSCSKGNG